jgi:UDP:flavonoid glycosyltransferase YjiC (YdhE family)
MRVGLQTWGTEGDVRPFFGLAQALMARGHRVRLCYTNVEGKSFERLAEGCGVEARDVGGDYFRANRDVAGAHLEKLFIDKSPLRQIRGILEAAMDPVVDRMLDAGLELAAESDVMVGHFMTHPAGAAASKHGRPYVLVSLQPILPSVHYAPIGTPDLGRVFNPLLWMIMGRVLESILRDRVNHARARAGIHPVKNLMASTLDHAAKVVTAVSPTLFPRPADWDPRVTLTGFLGVHGAAEPWEPDGPLAAFLEAGPPPVFLSFGSMFTLADGRTLEAVRAMTGALALAGARGIIQAPQPIIAQCEAHPSVHFLSRAPHAKLFPRCSAIVHHGGAGTTQSAVLAGRPSIVVPHAADQFFWADRLHARGLGAKPLKRTALTAARLAPRIRATLDDGEMRRRAEEASLALRDEDGPAQAAAVVESVGVG